MSLTNPNTPVSQQDLKDFYDKIKPYMGLYPSAMGKKVGKGDIYSTEERLIGQWQDGKPLYSKTIVQTYANGASMPTYVYIALGCVGTEEVKGIENAIFQYTTSSNVVECTPIATLFSKQALDDWFLALSNCSVSSNQIQLQIGTGWKVASYTNIAISFTLKYTKTTDSAISIGDETDYSTTEKIVGTWITGEPIWQRVLDLGDNFGITTTDKNVGTYSYIKQLINAVYIVSQPASNLYATTVTSAYMDGSDLHTLATQQWGGTTGRNIYLTIQYTKTS